MQTFDYIIVGGGSAGCVLANRLTEDQSITVLLIEAGPPDRSPWIDIPAGLPKLLNNPVYNWGFATEPDKVTYDRAIPIPRGRALGGSSSINGMLHVRGHPSDFDGWAQMGNRGWSYDEVLPFFSKSETWSSGNGEARGRSGPLQITLGTERQPLTETFIAAAIAEGYPYNPDYNNGDQDGVSNAQLTQKNGRRWSAARAYLDPARSRKNLSILTETRVKKLDLEGRRCIGVTVQGRGRDVEQIRAGKEVLLCAGAIQSPQVLELSGIGKPDILATAGIPVLHALPGVGENYQDHFATRLIWRVKKPVSLNEQSRGLSLVREVVRYALVRRGALSSPPTLACAFVRSRSGLAAPDIQMNFVHASYSQPTVRKLDKEPGMTLNVNQSRPHSRGSVHIVSSDVGAPPAIRANFLSAAEDQHVMAEGMRIGRRIVENAAFDHLRSMEIRPGSQVVTEDEWIDYARRTGQTAFHPVGTCRMGTDNNAVVDETLRVRGLQGLRVVDASIMPTIVSANTNAATIMIGEKGADMVAASARGNSS